MISEIKSLSAFNFILNANQNTDEIEINKRLPYIWNYNSNLYPGMYYISLMFYTRNIKKQIIPIRITENTCKDKFIPKGKCIKIISYYMVLWMLKHHKNVFLKNYDIFINLGYFRDCLTLAKMAKERNYSKNQIDLLLSPMAVALLKDENTIIQNTMSGSSNHPFLNLSLASKWAPREGKAFSEFIPNLKNLCNITGFNSQKRWRQYITRISHENNTIENILSNKDYRKFNYYSVPLKAKRLYKNTISSDITLSNKRLNFNDNNHINKKDLCYTIVNDYVNTVNEQEYECTKNSYSIDNTYITNNYYINDLNWDMFTKTKLRKTFTDISNTFIPVMGINKNKNSMQKIMSMGLIMSLTNDFMNKKAITFTEYNQVFNIQGNTMNEQIESVIQNTQELISLNIRRSIDLYNILLMLFYHYLDNKIKPCNTKNVNIVILNDVHMSASDMNLRESNYLKLKRKYKSLGYNMPKVTYWNISSNNLIFELSDNYITYMYGFTPYIINTFLDLSSLNTSNINMHKVSQFISLIKY